MSRRSRPADIRSAPLTACACPLCGHRTNRVYHTDHTGRRRRYLQCDHCLLVFVTAPDQLSSAEEKAVYDLHRNDPTDSGYRRFLSRLYDPLMQRLAPASEGLDFGCGPGPTLSVMLEEAGHAVALYDRFYAADESVWERRYDFITATEVVEHLAAPGAELQRLWHHLENGGVLALMTKLVTGQEAFSRWHYRNDPTHVCFFSRPTFAWLASQWRASLTFIGADVILLSKPPVKTGR